MAAATAQICPVVGTTTTALPPNHPAYDPSDKEARCPITNAKVAHHDNSIIHNHPSGPVDSSQETETSAHTLSAEACPALKNAKQTGGKGVTDATCPVVGPVSSYLPPDHPDPRSAEAGKVCPVTNATLEHHEGKVSKHPSVEDGAPAAKCPVAGQGVGA
ncbi:hypothetical protein MBLNU230_g7342t1 [Neophaeotheca triangularis]